MELVEINRNKLEIKKDQQASVPITIRPDLDPERFIAAVRAASYRLQSEGFDIFRLNFDTVSDEYEPVVIKCSVVGSRLETDEEQQARIARGEAYNARILRERNERLARIDRQKEVQRILGGLTLEQLKSLNPIQINT